MQIYLSSANIPTSGVLDMQFVNVRPRRHIDYPGMGLGKQYVVVGPEQQNQD